MDEGVVVEVEDEGAVVGGGSLGLDFVNLVGVWEDFAGRPIDIVSSIAATQA